MRAFFHPDQHLHDPQQFMVLGRVSSPRDLPARTEALLGALARHGVRVEEPQDRGEAPARAVHTKAYLEWLRTAFERWSQLPQAGPEAWPNVFPYWSGQPQAEARPPCPSPSIVAQTGWYSGDLAVPVGPKTWTSALRSTHSAAAAAAAVLDGEALAYALCRPSGHHARADRAAGFCYLNNSAIAATLLRARYDRVAVLDVDAHQGDGTQEIFYRRADVHTVSVHADPAGYYPWFTGYAQERGHGAGEGWNLNLPLAHGCGGDAFLAAVDEGIAAIRGGNAQALVLALGYDAHAADPLGVLGLAADDYRRIGASVAGLGLPTVIVQEGGYAIDVIGDCLSAVLTGLGG